MACESSVVALRKALRCELDVSIVTRKQVGGRQGPWVWLTQEQMTEVSGYRRSHMSGADRAKEWASQLGTPDTTDFKQAYAFWHNCDPAMIDLPDAYFAGLTSATRHFNVKLLSYQNLRLPPGVTWVSAEEYLPEQRMRELLAKAVHIVYIADFVRLVALLAGCVGGWFIDLDTLWIRAPDKLQFPWQAPAWGHVFASARYAPCQHTALERFQRWSAHFFAGALPCAQPPPPAFTGHIVSCFFGAGAAESGKHYF